MLSLAYCLSLSLLLSLLLSDFFGYTSSYSSKSHYCSTYSLCLHILSYQLLLALSPCLTHSILLLLLLLQVLLHLLPFLLHLLALLLLLSYSTYSCSYFTALILPFLLISFSLFQSISDSLSFISQSHIHSNVHYK